MKKVGLFVLFLICGLITIFVGISFSDSIPNGIEWPLRIGLCAAFLAAALGFGRVKRFAELGQVFYAFFVASLCLLVSWEFSGKPLKWLSLSVNTPEGQAAAKVSMSVCWIVPIILLVKLAGGNLDSISLGKGNLKRGLAIGLIGFGFFLVTCFFAANHLFKAHDLTAAKALAWSPWILIFVLCNAASEELLFRGLFLKNFAATLGPHPANFCAAIIFALAHLQVSYSTDVFLFMIIVFPLGLWWGYLMQKTNSIWGSVLFHAGADIPVMLGIFSRFS